MGFKFSLHVLWLLKKEQNLNFYQKQQTVNIQADISCHGDLPLFADKLLTAV